MEEDISIAINASLSKQQILTYKAAIVGSESAVPSNANQKSPDDNRVVVGPLSSSKEDTLFNLVPPSLNASLSSNACLNK